MGVGEGIILRLWSYLQTVQALRPIFYVWYIEYTDKPWQVSPLNIEQNPLLFQGTVLQEFKPLVCDMARSLAMFFAKVAKVYSLFYSIDVPKITMYHLHTEPKQSLTKELVQINVIFLSCNSQDASCKSQFPLRRHMHNTTLEVC